MEGDSFPVKISLPEPKLGLTTEPRSGVINQFTSFDYIGVVKEILSPMEFLRIRNIFLGLLIKMELRKDELLF
ncbi:unnamed protein product [Arabis nemorensis]|uniref:Uncharacterized protein n=1 Tax=Arabis nemorensis TaxID=586526 RepID=A0A565CW15_9BRAS|nr:unnamed protein product [Arabis nemorensis]